MTTMTLAPAAGGFSADELDRFAGRADAYDDHGVLTLEQLNVRASYITELHPNLAYAQGYDAYVKSVQYEQELISGRMEPVPMNPNPAALAVGER